MKTNKSLRLKRLPYRFRKVGGFGLFLTAVAMLVLIAPDLSAEGREIAKAMLQFSFILNLLLMIISEEKREDEFVRQVRERVLASVAVTFIMFAVLDAVFNLFSWGSLFSTHQASVNYLEVFYIIMFKINHNSAGAS